MKRLLVALALLFAVPAAHAFTHPGQEMVKRKPISASASSCTSTTCGFATLKQPCANSGSATTISCPFGANLTAPSLLILYTHIANGATASVTTTCGLTWTQNQSIVGSPDFALFTAPNSGTSACTPVVTSTSSALLFIDGVEISGSTTQIIDASSIVNAGSITNPSPISGTSITTTVSSTVVIQAINGYSNGGENYTAISGAFFYQNTTNGTGFQWQVQASAGAVNPSASADRADFYVVANLAVRP